MLTAKDGFDGRPTRYVYGLPSNDTQPIYLSRNVSREDTEHDRTRVAGQVESSLKHK